MSMETRTRSKTSAHTNPSSQQDTVTQEDLVMVNYLFFDKSRPDKCCVLPIRVPRSLFNDVSMECRTFFHATLLREFKFDAEDDVNSIKFWKPKEPLPADIDFEDWIEGINKMADSFKRIPYSRSFAESLKENIDDKEVVHLVVTATGSYRGAARDEAHDLATELPEIQRYRKIISNVGKSPSQSAKSKEYWNNQRDPIQVIHDGRHSAHAGLSTVAPPVQIFHPAFNTFTQVSRDPDIEPTNEGLRKVQELMHLLSAIGQYEVSRNQAIRLKLSEILGVQVHEEPNADRSSADGVYMIIVNNIRITILIVELKRELGDGGSDPSTQAGLMMKRSWQQATRKGIRDKCCCPTLMLAGGGPWLGVLGGVLTDKVIVQRLTDLMWFGHSSTEEDARVYHLARILNALGASVRELESYYQDISRVPDSSSEGHSRFYPYPTSFTDETGKLVSFEYVKMMEQDAVCVTFQAKILGGVDCPDIVVKFVSKYGVGVHKFLAERNHAPRLWYCGPLSGQNNLEELRSSSPSSSVSPGLSLGPMQMVVMDLIHALQEPPANARQQVAAVLTELHSAGYVFGDLRQQNILFDQKMKVKFIDLDWAGCYDMSIHDDGLSPDPQKEIDTNKGQVDPNTEYVCYPLNLSRSIEWADGVKSLEPIRPHHDLFMLDKYFSDDTTNI